MNIQKSLHLIKKIVSSPSAFGKYLVHCVKQYRLNDLLQFANEPGVETDKGVPGHDYVRVYDAFMRDRRQTITHLCEIGLLRNKIQKKDTASVYAEAPSLSMWTKYLPHAHVIGFDIKEFKTPHHTERCTIIQGDQSSRSDLKKILDRAKELDVVIDDALHASPHQQISLSYLFPHLRSGGLYVIEDLRYQPKDFERPDVPKTLDLLKDLATTGQWLSPLATPEEKKSLESQIKEIYFFDSLKLTNPIQTTDALVVIVKK